jgi:hypothetical protein
MTDTVFETGATYRITTVNDIGAKYVHERVVYTGGSPRLDSGRTVQGWIARGGQVQLMFRAGRARLHIPATEIVAVEKIG